MTIDTTKLREMAQKATPGPWTYFHYQKYKQHHVSVPIDGSSMTLALFQDGCQTTKPKEDAEYIAAANPATVLALLDELERTQGSLAIASEALSAAERELQRLRPIESAVENLKKAKGRHNTEIAYKRLIEAHSG